jgi:hypothetical protein
MGGAGDASAQSSACDQLKASLSARIEASGVRDYSLEAVPATAPTPANVRVIGTCDGGRTKVLYYRGVARQKPPDAPDATDAPAAARPPAVPASKAPIAVRERVPAPMPASMSEPSAAPSPAPSREPLPVAVPPPVLQAAPQPAPAQPAVTPQAPEPQPPERQAPEPAPTISLVQQAFSLAVANRIWLLALVLVPIAGWLWAWAAHRRAYDKAGLPRGPRL